MVIDVIATAPRVQGLEMTMAYFNITNTHSGAFLGTYAAATERDALDAMAREAGYDSYDALQTEVPAADGEIVVTNALIYPPKLSAAAVERAREMVKIIVRDGVNVDAVIDELREIISDRASMGETLSCEVSQSITRSRRPEFVHFDLADLR